MRKTIAAGLALIAVLALGTTAVFAQGPRGGFMDDGWGYANTLEELAGALDMEEDALLDALRDGQTAAEIAEAQGMALEDVVAALTADVAAELAEAVEAGDLSQAQADARLALHEANLIERLNTQVFASRFSRFDGMGLPGLRVMAGADMLDTVAEALNMDAGDLLDALQDGQTVAEIAEAQGMTLEDVSAALVAAISDELAAAVEAGDITQEEADAHLVLMEARLQDLLASELPLFGGRMFGDGTFMRGFDGEDFGRGMRDRMMDRMPRGGMRGGGRGG